MERRERDERLQDRKHVRRPRARRLRASVDDAVSDGGQPAPRRRSTSQSRAARRRPPPRRLSYPSKRSPVVLFFPAPSGHEAEAASRCLPAAAAKDEVESGRLSAPGRNTANLMLEAALMTRTGRAGRDSPGKYPRGAAFWYARFRGAPRDAWNNLNLLVAGAPRPGSPVIVRDHATDLRIAPVRPHVGPGAVRRPAARSRLAELRVGGLSDGRRAHDAPRLADPSARCAGGFQAASSSRTNAPDGGAHRAQRRSTDTDQRDASSRTT
jgi:hypothetical protein